MEIINNRFYDQNGNSWSCNAETAESAELKSKKLINCRDCRDCRGCSGCSDCRDWESNPQRYVTPSIGSRNAQTTFYFSKDKTQVVCGCFNDSLEAFTTKVVETHLVDSLYFQQCNKQIEIFKYLIAQL
jgi:hypothetical protein